MAENYLDNSTTTMMDAEVVQAMQAFLEENYGSPSHPYHLGTEARQAVKEAREKVALLMGANPSRVFFTSGGTEANNWVIKTFPFGSGQHIAISTIEHSSVREAAKSLASRNISTYLVGVDSTGIVSPKSLGDFLSAGAPAKLVCIQYGNGEIGTKQDIEELTNICHAHGALVHCDACQSFGKVRFDVDDLGVDYLSVSAHKLHGPMGVGALYVKDSAPIVPFLDGEGEEAGLRSGAANVPGLIGFAKAAELCFTRLQVEPARQTRMIEDLFAQIKCGRNAAIRNGHPTQRLPNILNVTISGMESDMIASLLNDRYGICVGTGTQEHNGNIQHSQILSQIGLSIAAIKSTLRFSVSHQTEDDDIRSAANQLLLSLNTVRKEIL